jgi:transposase
VYREDVHGRIVDRTELLDRELLSRFREKYPVDGEGEALAYDTTAVLFFDVTCPLTELGYNPDGIDMRQMNVAMLTTKKERHMLFHSVYEGSRNSSMTVRNMLSRLPKKGGILVWDRGYGFAVSCRRCNCIGTEADMRPAEEPESRQAYYR